MPDGTVVPASSNNWVLYESSQSGLYHATVDVTGGRVPATAGNNGLPGAYFAQEQNDSAIVQHGEIVVTVNATPFTVTFNANSGKINGLNTYTMTNQYKYPNLNTYIPVSSGAVKLLFDGWYIDKNNNNILDAEDELAENNFNSYLMGDVTYIAIWKAPLSLSGTVTVDGSYELNGVQQSVWERDRATEVAIVLQKKTGNAYNDIACHILPITYDETTYIGTTEAYSFGVPADGSDYRIIVLELNYTATYDADQDTDQTFTADENIITNMMENRTVNIKMTFAPDSYEQRLVIDASKVNSTYRPTNVNAKISYRNLGTNEAFAVISQHANNVMAIKMEDN
jgi:hypothetical protein